MTDGLRGTNEDKGKCHSPGSPWIMMRHKDETGRGVMLSCNHWREIHGIIVKKANCKH